MDKLYLFIDTEATGLNTDSYALRRHNKCLQISLELYKFNNKLEKIFEFVSDVKQKDLSYVTDMDSYVFSMHKGTGLLNRLLRGRGMNRVDIQDKIIELLKPYEQCTIVPVGNNIEYDIEVIRQNFPINIFKSPLFFNKCVCCT